MSCAADKTVQCGADWKFDEPAAIDTCSSVTVNVLNIATNRLCGSTYAAICTWRVSDLKSLLDRLGD